MAQTSRRHPTELRQLLLESAERAFRERGFHGTTAEEIATEAGVHRSVLYRHFDNKSDLFRHAVLLPFVEFLRDYDAAWRTQIDDPWDDLRITKTMVGMFYDSFDTHRETLLMLAAAAGTLDEESEAQLDRELNRFFDTMVMMSENEMRRRDSMLPENIELSVRLTLCSIAASVVLARLFIRPAQRPATRDEIVDHISRLILYGLALEPRPS